MKKIEITYKQINNTTFLIDLAKEIAEKNPSLLNTAIKEIKLSQYKYLAMLKNELTIAGNTDNSGIYNAKRNKIISYGVLNNLDHNELVQFIGSEKFRPYYEQRYIYKQALIKVIKSAMKKLPGFKSYAKELKKEGRVLEYDIKLKQDYQNAEKNFTELCKFYERRSNSVLTYIRETRRKDKFKFRYDDKENEILVEAALNMFKLKEKMDIDAINKVKNFPSLTKRWFSNRYSLQCLSKNQLELFLKLLKKYVQEVHQEDLKLEEKEASCKSSMEYHKSKNPGHVTIEEKKLKVYELYDKYKNYSKVEKELRNTPYKTSRQIISKWINEINVKISDGKQ